MYLDFEDYKPDIQPIGRAISWWEGILLSIIVHLLLVVLVLLSPRLFPFDPRARALAIPDPNEPAPRFVFMQPRVDRRAQRPPDRGEASDQDRLARSPERVPAPNPLPFSKGNTSERVESEARSGRGPRPDPAEGKGQEQRPADADSKATAQPKLPESQTALRLPSDSGLGRRSTAPGGLSDALKNLQRYVQRDMFDNPQGGSEQVGPLQFDSKGVEFGPWQRRFIAQVRRNWLPGIPYSAMMYKGHVVVTFNVHKDGALTDISVVAPCPVDAFNFAAFGALKASNPTEPLPPEYPADKAFFTITFYYNEDPYR